MLMYTRLAISARKISEIRSQDFLVPTPKVGRHANFCNFFAKIDVLQSLKIHSISCDKDIKTKLCIFIVWVFGYIKP